MSDFWSSVTENFNNREIAGSIWLVLVFALVSLKKDVRRGFRGIVDAVLEPRLIMVFASYAVCVAALAWIGSKIGVWTTSQIIPTTVWYFVGGLPLLFRAFDAKEGTQHFRGYAKAVISGIALLEFLYVAKTFSLPAELVLTPIVTIVGLLAVFSERDPEHASVNSLMNWLLAIVVVIIFWNSVSQIWNEPEKFFTTDTFRAFVLPIYLTIGSIPFFYVLHCYSHIQGARIQIDQKTFQSEELKRYAKKRFFLTFMARPWLLRRATRQFHIMPARENDDVDVIIRDILQYERDEESPPEVSKKQGWSPYAAREFLSSEGLRPSDYHAGYAEEEWWSGVASKELGEAILPGSANYSFSGVKGLVLKLRLKGHFVDQFVTDDALDEFSNIATKLCEEAMPEGADELRQRLADRDDFGVIMDEANVRLANERFPNEKRFELILEIERPVSVVSVKG